MEKITLQNGLRVITVPQKGTQAVTVLILIGAGSKDEVKNISGISHFLEHMTFKGTKKRPSAREVVETLDKIGGNFNAFTGQDYTGFFAKVEASQFELAFDWVADIFLNSTFPQQEFKKEKGVIVEEINMGQDMPMNHVGDLWLKLLYKDQPAGWNIAGTKESVMDLNRDKLINYKEKKYVSENIVLCVAGKITSQQVERLAKKYFSELKRKKPEEKAKVIDAAVDSASILSGNRRIDASVNSALILSGNRRIDASVNSALILSDSRRIKKQDKPQCLLEYKKTDQTHLCLGVRSYNIFHPQRNAQDILALILGGMMSSRLFVEIRDKLGLAYYIKTEIEANPDTGFLVTQTGVDNQRIEKAISVILNEYKKISKVKIQNPELRKAKDNMKGSLALLLESSNAQASFYGLQEILENKTLNLKETFERIEKITANDILEVARDIFKPNKLNLALIGPFKDKKRFEKLLRL